MIQKIRPQVFLICLGLIAVASYTAYLGTTHNIEGLFAITGTCAGGLVTLATKLVEGD